MMSVFYLNSREDQGLLIVKSHDGMSWDRRCHNIPFRPALGVTRRALGRFLEAQQTAKATCTQWYPIISHVFHLGRRTEGPYPCILAGQGWAEESETQGLFPHEMSSTLAVLPNCWWRVLSLDDSLHLMHRFRRKHRIDFLMHPFRIDTPLSHPSK
jgi:hypothetical protein